MSITSQRRTDPINVRYPKTARIITNDFGVFYKIRGGKLSAAFKTEVDAKKDLRVFLEILKIEQELNTDDLKLIV